MTLLVVDVDGVSLWSESGDRRRVVEGPVASALPDRTGGIVYQEREPGAWRADETGGPSTARWRWVGDDTPRPILRVARPGAAPTVVAEPPLDGTVRLVDSAIVEGHPSLAYLRTRYAEVTVTEPDVNPWWGSATAELVVVDLESGAERVVRTQDVGWEHDVLAPSLGAAIVAEVVDAYGDPDHWVRLLGFDGTTPAVPYEPPRCQGCVLVADLAPDGPQLVSAQTGLDPDGRPPGTVELSAIDHRDGAVLQRTTVTTPEGARPVALDTVDGRSLLTTLSSEPVPADELPELARGDEGPWVRVLQALLAATDADLAVDGVFGPRTVAAVRTAQQAAGRTPTGTVDGATWDGLLGGAWLARPYDPIVIEPDGSSRTLPVTPDDVVVTWPPAGPTISLWADTVRTGPG